MVVIVLTFSLLTQQFAAYQWNLDLVRVSSISVGIMMNQNELAYHLYIAVVLGILIDLKTSILASNFVPYL